MRLIDLSLNQLQLRALFDELKSAETGKVEIMTLVCNLTGEPHQTIDY